MIRMNGLENENLSSCADDDPKLKNMSFHVVERTRRASKCKRMKLRDFFFEIFYFEICEFLSPSSS